MAAKQIQYIFLGFLLILGFLATLAMQTFCRPLDEEYLLKKHEEWVAQHGRLYKDADEKQKRYRVFKENT